MANICTWTGATDGDWNKTGNWLEGDVPDTGDTVNISRNPLGSSDRDIDTNLDQSAVTVAALNIDAGYTGKIGTVGASGAYLKIGATVVRIGEDFGPGTKLFSPRIKLDLYNIQSSVTVFGTRSVGQETDLPPVRIIGTHASNVLTLRGGSVGVAVESGEVATFATINCGAYGASAPADLLVGPTVTLTNFYQYAGQCVLMSTPTNLYLIDGFLTTERSGAITLVTITGGTMVSNATGTITGCYVGAPGGTLDLLQSEAARTITALHVAAGGSLKIGPNITVTGGIVHDDRQTLSTAPA